MDAVVNNFRKKYSFLKVLEKKTKKNFLVVVFPFYFPSLNLK
jgi:hypothetical protein